MKEDFLHYLWLYKKFDFTNLKTISNKRLTIINSGQFTQLAGPDFFNTQIKIGNQKWAGNVEIHINSSDWYLHNHQNDSNYDTVILHVVWNYDTPIFDKNNQEIEVLEIQKYVNSLEIKKYQNLVKAKSWIYCENYIKDVNSFVWDNWKERLFLERLERKTKDILKLLEETNNNWEAVLFYLLAKNFGLNSNGETFLNIAKSIGFAVIRKESLENLYLEALFFGQANAIPEEPQDKYTLDLKSWYDYLVQKYRIQELPSVQLQFFKHRPDNFPTIRLAQLASIYSKHSNIFSKILVLKSKQEFYDFFDCTISNYWQNHYQLDKISVSKNKNISKSFIDLLLVNTLIPIFFTYNQKMGKDISEELIDLLKSLPQEKNNIISKYNSIGIKVHSAFETQALLQLKSEYCNQQKCLSCAVGLDFLK
jgi:hypothetical protein